MPPSPPMSAGTVVIHNATSNVRIVGFECDDRVYDALVKAGLALSVALIENAEGTGVRLSLKGRDGAPPKP